MYSSLMFFTLVAFITSTIFVLIDWFAIKKENGISTKGYKNFLFFLVIIFILSIIGQGALVNLYITEPEISHIEFDKVYRSGTSTEYYVQDKHGFVEIYEFDNVCKGNRDYIVCITQPKLTRKVADIIGRKQKEYILVLKDSNSILELTSNIE